MQNMDYWKVLVTKQDTHTDYRQRDPVMHNVYQVQQRMTRNIDIELRFVFPAQEFKENNSVNEDFFLLNQAFLSLVNNKELMND